ncbi:ATP-binding cassette domain-containing protein [Planosporangium flavigriseum]|uniref:ABC transporter ATP-binding protein n=1 Tax=Planosporangium flavigriseum TaxID=373681 RepID=UPI00143B2B4F|nr:ATP-binding cassette domain-containing protein [Planosporangium flavigriseum]NJC65731.1 ATP-binding cassette domain-containing protein [Planosporangium flavigriseum]
MRFGGVTAISNLSLSIREGEILGIAGPNGAGKTTLFNVISGHVKPVAGEVLFAGERISGLPPHKIFQRGVARTFQLADVITEQSFYANVLVGAHFAKDRGLRGMFRFGAGSYVAADTAAERYGLGNRLGIRGGTASLFERKMIMLASAMAHKPSVLLLDEPVGGLSEEESDTLLEHVQRIAAEGTTVVVIEHVMRVLTSVAQRLVILNRGELLFDGAADDAREDKKLQELYFGSTAEV